MAVVEVGQGGLLHRGGDRHDLAVFGHVELFADGGDGGGVGKLLRPVPGHPGGVVGEGAVEGGGGGAAEQGVHHGAHALAEQDGDEQQYRGGADRELGTHSRHRRPGCPAPRGAAAGGIGEGGG